MRTSKRWTAWILAVLLISCIAVPAGMAAPAETGPVVITLDPGHGGPDSGAVANGRKESDLNLTICQYIKQYSEDPRFVINSYVMNNLNFVGFNMSKPITGDINKDTVAYWQEHFAGYGRFY